MIPPTLDKANDPSQDLDESIWKDATPVFAGVFRNKETILWKDSSAYYKRPEDGEDPFKLRMKETGQYTLPEGWKVYVSGGEIRKA